MAGFLLRLVFAAALVFLTYNPTDLNYVRWSMANYEGALSLVVLFGLLLLTGYIIFLRATFRSIGIFGVVLVAALIAALLWVLADNGLLDLENQGLMTWIGLLALSLILAIGLSWSHVRRAISGQSDVDDVDE